MLLIIANIGTAVVVYPIFRRQYEVLSLGYVTARLAECTFIAIGIVSYLAVVTLHQKTAGVGAGSLLGDARSLVAVRNWTFVLGPGFFAGVGNGLILGYMMYRSGLMPRGLATLGLIGGSLNCISGLGVVLSDRQGVQGISDPRGRPPHLPGRRGSLSLTVTLGRSPAGAAA